MKIINVVGARPNFVKMAPIIEALNQYPEKFKHKLVHTGQHYDESMSSVFFEELRMSKPDIHLHVGSGSHAEQTAQVMIAFEKACLEEKPDLVMVVGDVNSTLACAITAKKLQIKVAHVEAGLRSRDMSMPEEINRLCVDAISDLLFTTDCGANENLIREGVCQNKIHFVGNVMIDSLMKHRDLASRLSLLADWKLEKNQYAVVTLHRPSNVDNKETLSSILDALNKVAAEVPVVFPVHPRTRQKIEKSGISTSRLKLAEPLGYLEMLHLIMNAQMVLTDSGGLQEETTVFGIPCLTLRDNTERPITCVHGTNQLVGTNSERILAATQVILCSKKLENRIPEKWDGCAANRIVEVLL